MEREVEMEFEKVTKELASRQRMTEHELRGRTWNDAMITFEVEEFGIERIVEEHNALLAQFRIALEKLTEDDRWLFYADSIIARY